MALDNVTRRAIEGACKGLTAGDLESLNMIAGARYQAERYCLLHSKAGETSIEGCYGTLAGMAASVVRFTQRYGDVELAHLVYVDLYEPEAHGLIQNQQRANRKAENYGVGE